MRRHIPVGLLFLALLPAPALCGSTTGEAGPSAGTGEEEVRAESAGEPKGSRLFPSSALYPRYLADPDAPATGIVIQFYSSTAIEQASDRRQHIKLGGIFPLLGWGGQRPGARRWQLRLDGGLDAQFDPDNQTDNTGWDGNYGLLVESARGEKGLAWRLGLFHIAAHLGDEWIERTGRRRVMYRREELLAAAAWRWRPGSRVYLEGGWAFDELNPVIQDPARVRAGFELQGRRPALRPGFRGYLAVDLSAWEERSWRLDAGAQVGLLIQPNRRQWRLGIQLWDGRVPLGEFFQETEANLGLGLWTEL